MSAACIDFDDFASLGILEHEAADGRKLVFVTIGNLHSDDVVPAIGLAEQGFRSLSELIDRRAGAAGAR